MTFSTATPSAASPLLASDREAEPPSAGVGRRRWLAGGAALLVGLLAMTDHVIENFHPVVAGQLYRSAQLGPGALEARIVRHRLGAIINLRGPQPQDLWYRQEGEAALRHGIPHYDLPLYAGQPPTAEEMRQIIWLLEECPKPVLIHCHSGIDRSGMVAAISVLLLDDTGSLAKARGQFTVLYGQFPWRKSGICHRALMRTYELWLEESGAAHSPARFRHWACNVYDGTLRTASGTN